ncbi:MAG: site-specific integrase [Bacteroidota bacterium]
MAIHLLPTITVVHDFKKNVNKNGKAPIYLRFYFPKSGKSPTYINTGIDVEPKYWDNKTSTVSRKHRRHYIFNRALRDLLDKYEEYIYEADKQGRAVTPKMIKEVDQPLKVSFTDFYRQMIEKKKIGYSDNTYKDYIHCHKRLSIYKDHIEFKDLTYKFLEDYKYFLFDEDLHPNTVGKHFRRIRAFVNDAIKYLDNCPINYQNHPFNLFKIPSAPTDSVWLNEYELKQVEDIQIGPGEKHLALIRDMFLFQCYTGLRFSDIHSLSASDIGYTEQGMILYRKAVKNKKRIHLPLYMLFRTEGATMSRPERIIQQRLDYFKHIADTNKGKQLPLFEGKCLQYVNRELKKVAAKIDGRSEVKKKLTTHAGRHTFGTYMASRIPLVALQQLMQHASPKTTERYVHITGASVNRSLDDVVWD